MVETTIGLRLKEARLRLGVSVDGLAEKSGVNRSLIYRIEAGKDTTTATLAKLVEALKLDANEILVGSDSPTEAA